MTQYVVEHRPLGLIQSLVDPVVSEARQPCSSVKRIGYHRRPVAMDLLWPCIAPDSESPAIGPCALPGAVPNRHLVARLQ
jgi:hypothetical protein